MNAHGVVADDEPVAPTRFYAKFWQLLAEAPLFAVGVVLVVLALFLAAFGPLIAPYNPTVATPDVLLGPSASHWFGTDSASTSSPVFSPVRAST